MNQKIGFVLDSTTLVTDKIKENALYEIVSLNVNISGKTNHELDLSDEDIISRLENCKELKSSSPAPGDFELAYKKLFEQGVEDIIVLPMSKENSATYNVAIMAKDLVSPEQANHIYVINTLINNFGLTNIMEALIYWLDKDVTGEQLAKIAEKYCKDSHLSFMLGDLKHLFYGGRLSRISCAIGMLFRIKPVIEMIDGKLVLTKKMRKLGDVVEYMMTMLGKYAAKYKKVYCRFIYLGNHTDTINEMMRITEKTFKNVEFTVVDRVGPVFLVHLGNDGIGITVTGVDDQD